ncbi:MAG: peptide deformylase [Alphaproteobacteria bacterium CG_4_10_14_0_2_um_filter_63_37]|nr:MAG: peptide deformylase [Proteobacteria bacterium CG1_02_64_396]PJA23921.1 MAG: peptide deformylase [Alphaproteobacteria bacterium CG_4_10_14_0_2_um_filter_63_37]
MAIREILVYPDPILAQVADEIGDVHDPEIQTLIDDLIETMQAGPGGVGIAAPQVGASRRLVVVDCSGHKKVTTCHGLMVLVNPEILDWQGMEVAREGCMSLPDYTADVVRAVSVKLAASDRDGNPVVIETEGFEARAIQHEMDHLEGKLFIDRVVSPKRDLHRRKKYK